METEIEERRNLTILFADLSGFTRLSSRLDPEDVQEVASICFGFLNKPIVNESGTIHKYEGDSVIALFGFPFAHEDDPERAVKASLSMIDLLPEVNDALSKKLKKETNIGLHVGISMGTVVVGTIGSKEKKEYTIMGDVVNLASRLKDVAKRGEIIVSEAVFRASRYLFDYEPQRPVLLKGIDEPIKLFKPLRVKKNPEHKRGIKGLYSPLVGRDKELSLITGVLQDLIKGKGGALFILGTAGIGKSRLFQEIKKSIVDKKFAITVLESRCLSYGETLPYSPFLQILEDIFEITEQDSKKVIQRKLQEKLRNIFPDSFEEYIPYFGHLFSIRLPSELDEKVKHLDAQALKTQIFVSIKKLLATLARDKPILIVCEDYHWIDPESLELLKFLFDTLEPFPILFIGLSRIEKEKEPYKTKENLRKILGNNYYEIHLTPLDTEASNQLVYNLLSIQNIPEQLKDKILSQAEGNPFYVEEIIRSLIDSEVLKYSSGVWSLASSSVSAKREDIPDIKIPDSVEGVIRSRLDKLNPDIKGILEKASIIGRSFQYSILEHLSDIDPLMLTLNLVILEDYEYISEYKKVPELKYIFRHPMLYEVTYRGILKKRRRGMHRRTAEIIENVYKERLDDFTEILAYQYARSDNTEKAIEWLKKAGHKAKDQFANDEAIRHFRELLQITKEDIGKYRDIVCESYDALGAIYALKGENETAVKCYEDMYRNAGDNKIIESKAKRQIAGVYVLLGRWDDALEILDETEEVLSGNSVTEMLEKVEIYNLRANIYKLKGEINKSLKSCERSLNILDSEPLSDSVRVDPKKVKELRALGISSMASVHFTKGEFTKAIELWEKEFNICEELNDKQAISRVLNNLGAAYSSIGEHNKAVEIYHQGLKVSEEIGDIQIMCRTSSNLGVTYYTKGDYKKAIELFRKSLTILEEIGDKRGTAAISSNMGVSYYYLGDHRSANGFFKRQLKIAEALGFKRGIGKASSNLSRIHKDWGEYDKAIRYCKQSLRIARELNNRYVLGVDYYHLGNIYLLTEDLKKAEKCFAESEDILKEAVDKLEDRNELIETFIVLARLKCDIFQIYKSKRTQDTIKDALNYIANGLKLAEELGSKFSLAKCYIVYGEVYASISDISKSEEYFRKGIKMLKELQQRKLLADSYLEYAKILKKCEDKSMHLQDVIKRYFYSARQIYKELKLTHKMEECNLEDGV